MKNVLIFGSNGYFGTFFCDYNKGISNINITCDTQRLDKNFILNLDNIDCVLYFAARTLNQFKEIDFLKINCDVPIQIGKDCLNKNIHFIYLNVI